MDTSVHFGPSEVSEQDTPLRPEPTARSVGEILTFERGARDHIGADCWWSYQTIVAYHPVTGRRCLAWLRRWGGPRHESDSENASSCFGPWHPDQPQTDMIRPGLGL